MLPPHTGCFFKFITDQINENEPDILTANKNYPLLIVSLDDQLLERFEAPETGWTHNTLVAMSKQFPIQWNICGADALLGEQWVGSTEV
ncbi:hypothetical protein G6Z92_06195 [Vibrio aestuarianus subsp. cardii]|uniref:hypothetical protein n=1 Tax=Vibrio aestuarianus TaxID=28171 RepID=UPI0015C5334E|nr:hypothetical protein [Vibrio aestuarianus]NGZ66575.1 hypothetical protein [Vibrio aestuarianus subsp. cardii]